MNARLSPSRTHVATIIVLLAVAAWIFHHVLSIGDVIEGTSSNNYIVPTAILFAMLAFQLTSAYFSKPVKTTRRQAKQLNDLIVAGIVPVYNEDPQALLECLRSMVNQTRKPNAIVAVNDGSKADLWSAYARVITEITIMCDAYGIKFIWLTQKNAGKRHAQAAALRRVREADIFWTCDSDSVSDKNALAELLKPFKDPEVQSVAGVVMAANVKKSFLVRFTDLWFVTAQLSDRASQSMFNSVWVNSGPIAAYRAEVVLENMQGYLTETILGRKVPFSDDSMLTLYAMMRGKTVQQPSAFCFSLMPEKISHFQRMYIRWMRGSFIRSLWRFRYLPVDRPGYWLHLMRWMSTGCSATLFVLAILNGVLNPSPASAAWLAAVPLIVGYAVSLRYLIIRRSDQSLPYQIGTWLLAPVAVVFALIYLRLLRWVGVFTFYKTGWGTRQSVEVTL